MAARKNTSITKTSMPTTKEKPNVTEDNNMTVAEAVETQEVSIKE